MPFLKAILFCSVFTLTGCKTMDGRPVGSEAKDHSKADPCATALNEAKRLDGSDITPTGHWRCNQLTVVNDTDHPGKNADGSEFKYSEKVAAPDSCVVAYTSGNDRLGWFVDLANRISIQMEYLEVEEIKFLEGKNSEWHIFLLNNNLHTYRFNLDKLILTVDQQVTGFDRFNQFSYEAKCSPVVLL